MNERVVHDNGAIAPVRLPAPSAPTTEATAKETSDRNPDTKEEPGALRVIPAWIRIVRRSPDPNRIVDRHIDDFRIDRLNKHDALAGLHGRDNLLLWS